MRYWGQSEIAVFSISLRHGLNLDGFYYDFTDAQVFRLISNQFAVTLQNAAHATITGFEAEFKYAATEELYLAGGLGYTDATFDEFDSPLPGSTVTQSFAGNELPRTPDWTGNILVQYTIPLNSGAEFQMQTDWNYQAEAFVQPDNETSMMADERTIGNISIRYLSADKRWSMTGWARNVTNDTYITNKAALVARIVEVNFGDPRTIGITFTAGF